MDTGKVEVKGQDPNAARHAGGNSGSDPRGHAGRTPAPAAHPPGSGG